MLSSPRVWLHYKRSSASPSPLYPAKDATGLMKGMKRPGVKRGPIGYGDDFYRWVAKTYLNRHRG